MGWLLDGPGQLASSAADVVAICRQLADVVLVEAPSLLSTYDGEALLPVVDRVLVVGEAGMTTVDQARQTGDLLRRDKAPVVGVVFTNLPPKRQELRAARIRAPPSAPAPPVSERVVKLGQARGCETAVRRESRTRSPRLARFTEKLRPSARRGPSIMESARQRLQGMFRRTRRKVTPLFGWTNLGWATQISLAQPVQFAGAVLQGSHPQPGLPIEAAWV